MQNEKAVQRASTQHHESSVQGLCHNAQQRRVRRRRLLLRAGPVHFLGELGGLAANGRSFRGFLGRLRLSIHNYIPAVRAARAK